MDAVFETLSLNIVILLGWKSPALHSEFCCDELSTNQASRCGLHWQPSTLHCLYKYEDGCLSSEMLHRAVWQQHSAFVALMTEAVSSSETWLRTTNFQLVSLPSPNKRRQLNYLSSWRHRHMVLSEWWPFTSQSSMTFLNNCSLADRRLSAEPQAAGFRIPQAEQMNIPRCPVQVEASQSPARSTNIHLFVIYFISGQTSEPNLQNLKKY
jgi:hypothetical protein